MLLSKSAQSISLSALLREKDRTRDRGGRERETGIEEREKNKKRQEPEREIERSRVVKIKNIKKQNLLYGCFKKQSTQKISNQKMKLKERDKSLLEYVQCMYNNVHAYKVPGF